MTWGPNHAAISHNICDVFLRILTEILTIIIRKSFHLKKMALGHDYLRF